MVCCSIFNKGAGFYCAESILKFVKGQSYLIPHLLPLQENGANRSFNNPLVDAETNLDLINTNYLVFPNPAINSVTVKYTTLSKEMNTITISNALGECVYQTTISPNTSIDIKLDEFRSGIYLFTAYNCKFSSYCTTHSH
jgi:hypothetical protein